jgi:hypothetical protein
MTFGLLDLVFSSLIVFFFLVKRAPLKIYDVWKGLTTLRLSCIKMMFKIILNSIKSLFILLQDFDILYYTVYIMAGIVGLILHPFLFAFHLMDFLKLDQLKTVVKAIYQPRIELGLALMLMIILEYYFGILGWTILYMDYD